MLIDANDQPRITDFGLARRLDGDSSLTLTGQVLGSPNFMPPEQATGKRGQIARAGKAGGESCDLIAVVGIERANLAATQIGKEIDSGILRRKLADRGIVERAADNCATIGVRILVNRIVEVGIR